MKYIPGNPAVVELSRRNLETLLAKLDDEHSAATLFKQEEYPGPGVVMVRAVEDAEHYSDRAPGPVYMPGTGEVR